MTGAFKNIPKKLLVSPVGGKPANCGAFSTVMTVAFKRPEVMPPSGGKN